jgi:hypothetical protein
LKRAAIVTIRTMIVLLLVAAALDAPLPRRSGDRVRIHLVDRSASVRVPGPRESLDLKDAQEIINHDREAKAPGDVVTWASFGRTLAWESADVDASGTDLSFALQAALGRNPTEIILYTDGRGDPGNALFLCRERGVPVHVLPIGPTSVRDVRFRRINSPASVQRGEKYSIEAVVEATYEVSCSVRCAATTVKLDLPAGVPVRADFPCTGPGRFDLKLDVDDACPENNQASVEVFLRSDKPRVLALSKGLTLPGVELTLAQGTGGLAGFDAVVVDNMALRPDQQQDLADFVKSGGGLVLLGGEQSYGLGNWQRGPLAAVSPLKPHPDLKLAVVLGLDSSGSMTTIWERAVETLLDMRGEFDPDDDVVAMTFSDTAKILEPSALRKERPSGPTVIAGGIRTARLHLEGRIAGRKVIVLMTDGETQEKPEAILAEIAQLKDIALYGITTNKKIPGASRDFKLDDWNGLREALKTATNGMQDLERRTPGILDLRAHPVTTAVQTFAVAWINRTTAKTDAQVLATVGVAPQQDPVLALRPYGDGRVAAFTVKNTPELSRLLSQALDFVIGDRDAGLTLSIEPPLVIATGSYKDAEFQTEGTPVLMKQVGPRRWEGRLPGNLTGPVLVRKGRARAAATIACPPEFEALGVDRAALERIAGKTGGSLLKSTNELEALPRPRQSAPRSGRTVFLIAALALVFVELGVSIYWKV